MGNKHTTKIIFSKYGRYLLAIVLLVSGTSKCLYLHGFSVEVSQYSELYVSSALMPFSSQIAIFICCIEIVLGLFLLLTRFIVLSTSITSMLMLFFLYLTGVNYFFPTSLGRIESCGCFGELVHFSAKGAFIKTLILCTISFTTFFLVLKEKQTLLYKRRVIRKA